MTDQEINKAIAEKFLNLSFSPDRRAVLIDSDWVPIPAFTIDPAACALVKAEVRRRRWSYIITYDMLKKVHNTSILTREVGEFVAEQDTEEWAVCLAALRAVGVEV